MTRRLISGATPNQTQARAMATGLGVARAAGDGTDDVSDGTDDAHAAALDERAALDKLAARIETLPAAAAQVKKLGTWEQRRATLETLFSNVASSRGSPELQRKLMNSAVVMASRLIDSSPAA